MSETPNRTSTSLASAGSWPTIALIGCGAIAERYYLPALARHPSVLESLTLVDRNVARAQELATQFNVGKCRVDYRDILEAVDGVIVAVPTHLHHPISMECLSRGVHVLCEKPLADSAHKAREMVEQARRTGVVLSTNYQRRLFPNLVRVKELLMDKTFGDPLSIKYFVGEKFDWPTVSGFYFKAPMSSRGVLRDRGAHVLDVICWWLGGRPRLISSKNDSFGGSEAVAYVRFEHGECFGEIKLSWLSKFPCRFAVTCETGTIEGEVYDFQRIVLKTESGHQKQIKLKSTGTGYIDLADRMVSNFISAISDLETPLVPASDVIDSIEFIEECYRSATRFNLPWYDLAEVQSA